MPGLDVLGFRVEPALVQTEKDQQPRMTGLPIITLGLDS